MTSGIAEQEIEELFERWVELLAEEGRAPDLESLARGDARVLEALRERTAAYHRVDALLRPGQQMLTGRRFSHFRILERLGTGGMGVVYRALDEEAGREVALKILPRELAQRDEVLSRFRREAALLASLKHPNIQALYGFGEDDGIRFLALELVVGMTLARRLDQGALALDDALALFCQVADALAAAHTRRIVHRDLTPSNVMITAEGRVKVLDFGLGKALEPASLPGQDENPHDPSWVDSTPSWVDSTADGTILGTVPYMSPEQARGERTGTSADAWSFGCVLFEALAGRPPFRGKTVYELLLAVQEREPDWAALPPELPAVVRDLLRACLEKDEQRRRVDLGDARLVLSGLA